MGNLLKPTNDLIFKRIFGDSKNIDILTDFLKSTLHLEDSEYGQLIIVDPHLMPNSLDDKMGILDIKLQTKSGKTIDIEIQVLDVPQMRERILFYTSKMITEQIGKGDSYNLKQVISIVITNYTLINENEKYHNIYRLDDIITGSRFTDAVEINTLELTKLPENDDETLLWKWLKFLKSGEEEELSMLAQNNPQIEKAVGILKELSQDERARMLYDEREKALRDYRARIGGAFENGKQEGIKQGIQQGMRQGIIETAIKALKMGITLDDVIKLTGLTYEETEELYKEAVQGK